MDHTWQIAGHKKQQEFLANSLKNGKLAHAFMFAGPSGVGKKTLAKKFAQTLLCEASNACNLCPQCKTFIAAANADFLEIADTETIKIEQIRELIYKLSLKPYLAKYKVAVIDNAESMTLEASNALLKSLEEPKTYTIIILVSSNPFALPRTILSRTQKINFGLVDFDEFKTLLPSKLNESQKTLISQYANGLPGFAIKIANDEQFLEKLEQFGEYFEQLSDSDVERVKLAKALSDLEVAEIKEVLDYFIQALRNKMLENGNQKLAQNLNLVSTSKYYLDQNANSKLLVYNMILNFI